MTETKKIAWPFPKNGLSMVAFGGCGQFGTNLMAYVVGEQILVVDMGFGFAGHTVPGIDLIVPDVSFLEDYADRIAAVLITHGHEDHIGSLPYLWDRLNDARSDMVGDLPLYASSFTSRLIGQKFPNSHPLHQVLTDLIPRETVTLADGFVTVLPIATAHSAPESLMLHLTFSKEDKTHSVLHTGDWKWDETPICGWPIDIETLTQIGKDGGVDIMVSDSTNIMKAGETPSDALLWESLRTVLETAKDGALFLNCMGISGLARIHVMGKLARETNRRVALVGASMQRAYKAALNHGLIESLGNILLDEADLMSLPASERIFICTGSQGEPRAALYRITNGTHPRVKIGAGDTVAFSARIIPGNEVAVSEMKNELVRRGVRLLTNTEIPHTYVTGHGHAEDTRKVLKLVKPRAVVAVHGDYDHQLALADLAKEAGIISAIAPENGEILSLDTDKKGTKTLMPLDVRAPVGKLAVDGDQLIDLYDANSIAERRKLGYNGAVAVSILVDEDGTFIGDPVITLMGLAEDEAQEDDLGTALDRDLRRAVSKMPDHIRYDENDYYEALRVVIRRTLREVTGGKKPLIALHILDG